MRSRATIIDQLEIIIQMVQELEKWSIEQEEIIITSNDYDERFTLEIIIPLLRESRNYTRSSNEILTKYKESWDKEQKNTSEQEDEQHHWKCMSEIINVLRFMLFIPTFSEIEYAMTKTLNLSTHPVGLSVWQKNDRKETQLISFFRDIIRPSTDKRLFGRREEKVWRGIIWLRNNLIHNKGIAMKRYRFRVYDLEIAFEGESKIWARVDAFILLTKWVQEHFMKWFDTLNRETNGETRDEPGKARV